MNTAAELLKRARMLRRLNVAELARVAGVPRSTISRIEKGRVSPSFDTMSSILNSIGFTLSSELHDEPDDRLMLETARALQRGEIPEKQVFDRLRVAAQTAPVLQRPGVRTVDATLAEVWEWSVSTGSPCAISGLEACSQEPSFRPILYLDPVRELPWAAPGGGNRGTVILPMTGDILELTEIVNGMRYVSEEWAIMDAIASPGRQADVALALLEMRAGSELKEAA